VSVSPPPVGAVRAPSEEDGPAEEPVAAAEGQGTALPLVLLVVRDEAARHRLALEAAGRGMRVALAANEQDVAVQVGRERPSVAVVDLAVRVGALDIAARLAGPEHGVPVVALGEAGGLDERVEAARRGAGTFLDPGASSSDVLDQVALAMERSATVGSRVLLVDSRADDRDAARKLLEAEGLEVHVLAPGDDVWEALNRVNPSLLLFEESGGAGVSGIDLCRVLRNEPHWIAVPIVLVVDSHDPASAARAFSAGADDYLARPLASTDLASRAQSLLARHRVHQALAETDALTGLANRRTSTTRLGYLIRLAHRLDKPLCIAEIDIDHFKQVNDRYGHMAGDAALRRLADVLRRSFGSEDVVARWGGEEFIVGMFGHDRNQGVDRIADVLAEFRGEVLEAEDRTFSLTFSAGVAQYPLDGESLDALYRSADAALYTAKANGRNQVAGAAAGAAQQVVDVAVIEDDDATADLIAHTLTQAGLRWWRFSNGASAAAQLSGEIPQLRARVVLLDVSMPAFDGFEVLALLARDGVLESTKVMMLTAMADEADKQRARELGAHEYITKPFDVEALVQGVTAAMGR
jgi:diguanylate cyclase (GGDEF)-like protein